MNTNLKTIIGILTAVVIAAADAHAGRWLSRDPIQEGSGFVRRDPTGTGGGNNLYIFCGNSSVNFYDVLGLVWNVERKGGARASAIPQNGDTVAALAGYIRLNASEYKKWLWPIGGSTMPASTTEHLNGCARFTIPNTAYVDLPMLGHDLNGALIWAIAYPIASQMVSLYGQENLKVVFTQSDAVNARTILGHLDDNNLYKYFYLGHGADGSLASADDAVPPWGVSARKETPYGIAEMWLLGCGMLNGERTWLQNVSQNGLLIISDNLNNDMEPLDLILLNFEIENGTAQ